MSAIGGGIECIPLGGLGEFWPDALPVIGAKVAACYFAATHPVA